MSARTAPLEQNKVWISVTQCAWCRSIKVGSRYIKIPRMPMFMWHRAFNPPVLPPIVISMTHGVCPTCGEMVCRTARSRRMTQHADQAEKVAS